MKIVSDHINEIGLGFQIIGSILFFKFEFIVLPPVGGGLWQVKEVPSLRKAWIKVKIGIWSIIIGLGLQILQGFCSKIWSLSPYVK